MSPVSRISPLSNALPSCPVRADSRPVVSSSWMARTFWFASSAASLAACVASSAAPLSKEELEALAKVRERCAELRNVYCTGCNYCGPVCPKHVAIPAVLEALIYDRVYGFHEHARERYRRIGSNPGKEEMNASACVRCGLCETKCPQKLPIRKHLAEALALFSEPAGK